MTLAHELGHGILARGILTRPPNGRYTPYLAETASVFGEMLAFRSMLVSTTKSTVSRCWLVRWKIS